LITFFKRLFKLLCGIACLSAMVEGNRSFNGKGILPLYQKHMNLIVEHEEVLIQSDNDQLLGSMINVDELFKDVREPAEAFIDAKVVHKLSTLARKKSEEVGVNIIKFNQYEFTERLRLKMSEGGEDLCGALLIKFGKSVKNLFAKSPVLDTPMSAALNTSGPSREMEVEPRKERQARPKPGSFKELVATPQQVFGRRRAQSTGKKVSIEKKVEVLRKQFKTSWKNAGKVPVDFFNMTLNPTCFGETVENFFHFSFLVSEGSVSVTIGEDGRPQVSPVKRKHRNSSPGNAVVFNLSMEDWRRLGGIEGDNPKMKGSSPEPGSHPDETFMLSWEQDELGGIKVNNSTTKERIFEPAGSNPEEKFLTSAGQQEELLDEWFGNNDEDGLLDVSFYGDFDLSYFNGKEVKESQDVQLIEWVDDINVQDLILKVMQGEKWSRRHELFFDKKERNSDAMNFSELHRIANHGYLENADTDKIIMDKLEKVVRVNVKRGNVDERLCKLYLKDNAISHGYASCVLFPETFLLHYKLNLGLTEEEAEKEFCKVKFEPGEKETFIQQLQEQMKINYEKDREESSVWTDHKSGDKRSVISERTATTP